MIETIGFLMVVDCLEVFRCGSLLFRRFSDGWRITGPVKALEAYADALERDLDG